MVRLFKAQGVDNERAHTFKIMELVFWHALHVGYISKIATYAETQDGKFAMKNVYRQDLYVANRKRPVGMNRVERQTWNARIKL